MNTILFIMVFLAFFALMEFVAWFTHKYVMHGFLWVLHKDHHIRDGRKFEWNDLFAVIFAIPSILLIYYGTYNGNYLLLAAGTGILGYGFAYFMFHDVLVHQRIKVLGNFRNRYLRATMKAHMDHHKPKFFANYGFLFAPPKYYREEFGKEAAKK